MHGGEHEVPRQRSLHGDIGRLTIADFADHDDIGILTQYGAQSCGKCHPDLGIDLSLADALHRIFHRIFHGENIARAIVQPFQASI